MIKNFGKSEIAFTTILGLLALPDVVDCNDTLKSKPNLVGNSNRHDLHRGN